MAEFSRKLPQREFEKKHKSKIVGPYKLGKTLGKGTFSKVKLGTQIYTNEKVAIKILKPFEAENWKTIEREIEVLRRLTHPNIIRLHEVLYTDDDGSAEERILYMILDLAEGGELFDHIIATAKLKEDEARRLFRQAVSALEYMHAHLVVHRDLKPENLLLDKDKNIKINDFGLSNFINPGVPLKTFCGSPIYAAPEIVSKKKYEGTGVDVWSLGIILFTMTTGHMPWKLNDNEVENMSDMLKGRFTLPASVTVSPECMDLMKRMIVSDPKKRATLQEVRMHKWTSIGYDNPPPCLLEAELPVAMPDEAVIKKMVSMGHTVKDVKTALSSPEKNHLVTIYHTISKQISDAGPSAPQLTRASTASYSPRLGGLSSADRGIAGGKSKLSQSLGAEATGRRSMAMAYLDEEDHKPRGQVRRTSLGRGSEAPTAEDLGEDKKGFFKNLFKSKK